MSFPEETNEEKRRRWTDEGKGPRRRVPGIQILALILPLIMLLFFVPTGVYMERPGDAVGVEDRITITDAQTYENPGSLMLTTVSLTATSLLEMTISLFGDAELYRETTIIGPNPDPDRENQREAEAIDQSKQAAAAAALLHLGYPVSVTGGGVLVVEAMAGEPAEGLLEPDDVIIALNGQQVLSTTELTLLLNQAGIGVQVVFRVTRNGSELDIPVTTTESKSQPGKPVVGIVIQDQLTEITLPFTVTIDTGGIGGPSAGTMMALSIIDVLTPGGITGGKTIAGTGTIDVQGNVGAIGGINFKIAAAEAAGAVAFIYPADNGAEIDRAKAEIPLYPVRTLEEALQAVYTIATTP